VVIRQGGRHYQLTAGHLLEHGRDAAEPSSFDPEECHFDGQSDDEDEDADQLDVEVEMTSRGSLTPIDILSWIEWPDTETDLSRTDTPPGSLDLPRSIEPPSSDTRQTTLSQISAHGQSQQFHSPKSQLILVGTISPDSSNGQNPGLD
jgi:hypothetical protein